MATKKSKQPAKKRSTQTQTDKSKQKNKSSRGSEQMPDENELEPQEVAEEEE